MIRISKFRHVAIIAQNLDKRKYYKTEPVTLILYSFVL